MRKETYFSSDWMMYQAAYLFFIERLQQKEICEKLGLSAATISRLIRKAQEEQVVCVSIREPYAVLLDTAEKLKQKYGLKDAVLAQFPNHSKPEIPDSKHAVALEGARYLQRIITGNDIVGLAWGGTISCLINYLNPCQKTNASFVTMHGSIAACDFDLDVQTLTSRAAMALGGTKNCLFSNGLLDSAETVTQLKKEKTIRSVFELFDRITISISGIGVHYPKATSLLSTRSYLSAEEYELLKKADVCGDIMLHFFDRNGRECRTDLRERTFSIDLDTYRKIPVKILTAAGADKAVAMHTALKSGFCDVLIADQVLAEELLKL